MVLAPLLDGDELPLVRWLTGTAWILECLRALRIGNRRLARDALRRALTQAERSGVVRPLVTAPAEVADLLSREVGSLGGADGLAREVLALRAGLEPDGLGAPPLTAREAAVLELLPSLLLARRDRRAPDRLPQHREDAPHRDLRQARGALPPRRRGPRPPARPLAPGERRVSVFSAASGDFDDADQGPGGSQWRAAATSAATPTDKVGSTTGA